MSTGTEEKIRDCNELEIFHLLKSGTDNPKITEHCTERIKMFIGLLEDTVFKPISLNSIESFIDLAWTAERIGKDIVHIKSRIKLLEEKLNSLLRNEKSPESQDKRGNRPNI